MAGLRQLALSIGVVLASVMSTASAEAAKQTVGATACTANHTAAGLEVHCPDATVAELLAALGQAAGLRCEFPQELASVRVSVTIQGASLARSAWERPCGVQLRDVGRPKFAIGDMAQDCGNATDGRKRAGRFGISADSAPILRACTRFDGTLLSAD